MRKIETRRVPTKEELKRLAEQESAADKVAKLYQHLFGSANGTKVLGDLERICGSNTSSPSQAGFETNKTMFYEGQRSVYLHIKRLLERKVEKK